MQSEPLSLERYWILKYPDGNFVGLDDISGGYPYRASWPSGIKWWSSRQKAEEYMQMFPDRHFTLHKVMNLITEEVIENG